jgi:riboflavin synthase
LFTGLIQETGEITSVEKLPVPGGGAGTRITVSALRLSPELAVGDSIAVSGVCLTAVNIRNRQFSADLAQETLQRTSLGQLHKGSLVNLELPARAQDRLGGHIVQGHVDGTGSLLGLEKIQGGEDWRLKLKIPDGLAKYVVPQGSITVEGISLTIASIDRDQVEIAIIPHTYQATNLHSLRRGDLVNIEVDVLAKYAEKMPRGTPGTLTLEDLVKRGF